MFSRLTLILPVLALLAVLGAQPSTGHASELNRVAAVVNDEAISAMDLHMRMRMIQATSKMPDTDEVRQRLASQVLRKMIEERLMGQEAKRLKLTASKEDVFKQVAMIESQNHLDKGGLEHVLKSAGVPMSVLYRQLEAELSWGKVVRTTMAPQVKVTLAEVKDHLDMLKANIGQPEFQLAEIVLPVDDPGREAEVEQTSQRIIEQLKKGASFQNLARQFSQGASAANGGDVGWLPVASLEPEVAKALDKMTLGTLSEPIRAVDGYHIVLLRDRRLFGEKSAAEAAGVLSIAQLFVPANNDRENATRRILEISAGIKNCAQMEEVAKHYRLAQSGRGTARLAQMSPQAREFISGLKLLQLSPPLQDQAGVRRIMVCGKVEEPQQEAGLPSEEMIKSALERQRLELLSQRALRDLKRTAFVEIKS